MLKWTDIEKEAAFQDKTMHLNNSAHQEMTARKLENFNKLIQSLERAINRLESADSEMYEYVLDSVDLRFKFLIDSIWKNINLFLQEQGFIDLPIGPKEIVSFALEAKFISKAEHEALLKYLLLRNNASHIYDQPQYVLVATAAPGALALCKALLARMENKQTVIQ